MENHLRKIEKEIVLNTPCGFINSTNTWKVV